MFIHATTYLKNVGISTKSPQDFLRVLVISEHIYGTNPNLPFPYLKEKLRDRTMQHYLYRYGIAPVDLSKEPLLPKQVMQIRTLIPNLDSFRWFMNDAFPHTLKNEDILRQLGGNPLSLYTCVYALLAHGGAYDRKDVTNGSLLLEQVYEPKKEMWVSLGLRDIEAFISCWKSVHYYDCISQRMFIPLALQDTMTAYRKNKIPRSVLLSHYVWLTDHYDEWDEKTKKSPLFNPWMACHETDELPQLEHGITLEESLFNDCVYKLAKSNVKVTDIINGLYYRNRGDSLVEKNILFPTIKLEIGNAERVLVVNPSPDFLVTYSEDYITRNKRTTFVTTDDTIAKAYSVQFCSYRAYNFVTFEEFVTFDYLPNNHQNLLSDYDYVIIMARDANTESISNTLRWCSDHARLVLFLPQTMMTSKSAENIMGELEDNCICIDSILELPSAMSASGRRKKMILRGHVSDENPSHFALVSSQYHTPDLSAKKARQKSGKATHYVIADSVVRCISYDKLRKNYTVRQMLSDHDRMLYADPESGVVKKHYITGRVFPFSQDIGITMNLYQQADGRYHVRAYRQFESNRYGHSHRQKRGSKQSNPDAQRRLIRTEYYETGPCSLEDIYERITKWALRPNIMAQIVQDLEAYYADRPEALSLKTVWYCIREDLISTYMTYDDELAIGLFCGSNQQLSDLPISGITEEKIFHALQLTVPDGEDGHHYRRLLDLIFRMAVRRGYMDIHPFTPAKTSLKQECQKAMRQLREALGKDSLEFHELRKMLAFLLEPIDAAQTPRVVADSRWLAVLLRICTGMPLREVCALTWSNFHQIEDLDAYQLHVTHLINDFGEPIRITSYQYIQKFRKVPCPTLLSKLLLQRLKYMEQAYGIPAEAAMELPIAFSEEPGVQRVGRKKSKLQCTISQARKLSSIVLKKAEIPSDVVTLLDAEAAFQEELNACRNDIYYSSFLHHANNVCGLSDGQVCYLVGRKGPNCFYNHYIDCMNSWVQLDMITRLDRLFAYVLPDDKASNCSYTTQVQHTDHSFTVIPSGNTLASADVTVVPTTPFCDEGIRIRVACEHGVECKITIYS